jgi:protein-disulfide isomerase
MKNNQFISLLVLIVIWIGSTHFVISKIPEKVTKNMLAIEYDKVWWMDNYVKINKLNKEQIVAWLKQYEAQNWRVKPVNNQWTQQKSNVLSAEQIAWVTKTKDYVLWTPWSEIVWVEYSDLECPYCKKLHESWVIEKILKDYKWKVSFIFKQFPLTRIHPQAPMESEAALCVWEFGWASKYYEFINLVYANSKVNGKSFTDDSISKIWSKIWIEESKILACIKSWKYKNETENQLKEWNSLFGVTWTPWNILLNTKTGRWVKMPWALPYEAFKQKIDSLMK